MALLPRIATGSALLFACLALGCGDAGRPLAGSFHLDPRLADGTSAAQALADGLTPRPVDLGTLEAVSGTLQRRPDGILRIVPDDTGDTGAACALRIAQSFPARSFESVRVDLRLAASVPLTLAWNGHAGPASLRMEAPASREPRPVVFRVSGLPGWGGTIEDLRLVCEETGFEVTELELIPPGFRWGWDAPTEGQRITGRRGDAGLREQGHEARRSWPSDLGIPLLETLGEVPRGAVLSVGVGRGNELLRTGVEIQAAVDVREPGGTWRRLASCSVPDAPTPRQSSWTELQGDLSDYAGGPVELRFCAVTGPMPDAAAFSAPRQHPKREAILWGAPLVSGVQPEGRRPNIVLVTLDTTRFDAINPTTTPHLEELASRGVRFVNAWSSSNSTTPSHASILTGLPAQAHGALSNRHVLPANNHTLAESLRELGYVTVAAVSTGHIQANVGFGQGFDAFGMMVPNAQEDGSLTLRRVLGWMETWDEAPDRPFFLWLHLFDPHTPYRTPDAWVEDHMASAGIEPPPRTADPPTVPVYNEVPTSADLQGMRGISNVAYLRFLYDLGVSYADALTGRLVQALEERGVLDDTLFAVVADHGESLGEHGVWCAHYGLHEENLKVPLVLTLPPNQEGPRGLVVDELVSSLDLMPTLLSIAGAPLPPDLPGEHLLEVAFGAGDPHRAVWFEYPDLLQVGFRDDTHHFVTTLREFRYGTQLVEVDGRMVPRPQPMIPVGTNFLFDHGQDPGLENDLAPGDPAAVQASLERLNAWRAGMRAIDVERRTLTAEEEQELQDLGYAGDG